jgi:hypothetical protein
MSRRDVYKVFALKALILLGLTAVSTWRVAVIMGVLDTSVFTLGSLLERRHG